MNKLAWGDAAQAAEAPRQTFAADVRTHGAAAPWIRSDVKTIRQGSITYYPELEQGSEAWLQARCGLLTASEMHLIIAPPPEPETRIKKNGEPYKQREWKVFAENDKCRAHLWELAGQRVTRYVEPAYISDDMLRGREDEIIARDLYEQHCAAVQEMGFITNDEWGFTLGFSPDGLVGDGGFIEGKSRRQKYQMETLIEHVRAGTVPPEYVIQIQTGFVVSKRQWCDFLSFHGGLHMPVIRVFPDPKIAEAILEASATFESQMADKLREYEDLLASDARLIPTERRIVQEMYV